MKLDITCVNNKENATYEIPKGYLVLNIFETSPLSPNFFILGRNLKQEGWYGLFYFDGIGSTPISYETFYEKEPVDNSK